METDLHNVVSRERIRFTGNYTYTCEIYHCVKYACDILQTPLNVSFSMVTRNDKLYNRRFCLNALW